MEWYYHYPQCHNSEVYQGADVSLAPTGKETSSRKHVRDARDFNKIETRAVIKFLFLQGKALKEIHAILTETLACFLAGRAKDISAPRVLRSWSSGLWQRVLWWIGTRIRKERTIFYIWDVMTQNNFKDRLLKIFDG